MKHHTQVVLQTVTVVPYVPVVMNVVVWRNAVLGGPHVGEISQHGACSFTCSGIIRYSLLLSSRRSGAALVAQCRRHGKCMSQHQPTSDGVQQHYHHHDHHHQITKSSHNPAVQQHYMMVICWSWVAGQAYQAAHSV
jgi:hypothetical protein